MTHGTLISRALQAGAPPSFSPVRRLRAGSRLPGSFAPPVSQPCLAARSPNGDRPTSRKSCRGTQDPHVVRSSRTSRRRNSWSSKKPKNKLISSQIAYMNLRILPCHKYHESTMDVSDLCYSPCKRRSRWFDMRWDEVLPSITKTQQDNILESMYIMRLRESEQRKTTLTPLHKRWGAGRRTSKLHVLENFGQEVSGTKDT